MIPQNMLDYSTLTSDWHFHPIFTFLALHDKQTLLNSRINCVLLNSRMQLMLNMIMIGLLVGKSTVLLISKQREQLINFLSVFAVMQKWSPTYGYMYCNYFNFIEHIINIILQNFILVFITSIFFLIRQFNQKQFFHTISHFSDFS